MLIYDSKVLDINPVRAGVIPYTIDKFGELHFLLGIDRRTRELTDFGGGIKTHETSIQGALRELHEESCRVFTTIITKTDLEKATIIVNNKKDIVLFLVYIEPSWLDTALQKFRQNQHLYRSRKYNELISIKWIREKYFPAIAYNPRNHCMWKKIKKMFTQSGLNWAELRLILIFNNQLHQTSYPLSF